MSETIKISGREVTVRQLTMRQVREYIAYMAERNELRLAWLEYRRKVEAVETGTRVPEEPSVEPEVEYRVHTVDMLFDDDIPAKVVSLSSGLSLEELDGDYTQQNIRELIDKVRAVNPFLVGMMERLSGVGHPPNGPSLSPSAD